MAYISVEHSPSVSAAPRVAAPRLAWGRIALIGVSLAFWVGLAFTFRALF